MASFDPELLVSSFLALSAQSPNQVFVLHPSRISKQGGLTTIGACVRASLRLVPAAHP